MSHSQELAQKYIMNFIKRTPLTLVKGKGVRVWDEDGKEYLDLIGGWAVNSLGHCHPVTVKALTEQANILIQASNQFYTLPAIQLAELLVKNSCFSKVFFSNSGAEANEGAVKLARRYGQLFLNGAYEVITATNSFHGRTLAMVAATGQEKFQKPYLPLPAGFVNVKYDSIAALKEATTDKTCAVMVEPIQGEGGVILPSDNYLKEVRAWCDQKGLMLIFDEIQTGIGRMGTLFGYQHYGVEPDVITLAKGLAGGVAIGAFMAKEKFSVFKPGEHGTTFGGNPLSCAAAYATLKYIIESDIPGNAKKVGQKLMAALNKLKSKYPIICDVRGCGLLAAMEFKQDIAEAVILACISKNLLVTQLKSNLIRFTPPLIISNKEIDEAMTILDEVLSNICK